MAVAAAAVATALQSTLVRFDVGVGRSIKFQGQGVRWTRKSFQSFGERRSSGFSICVRAEASQFSGSSKLLGPIIVIDNYDSFTYNLCQSHDFKASRNYPDQLALNSLWRKNPRGILISPGPGTPQDSGIALQSILQLGADVPIFGVCMGLQCMGEAYGGKVVRAPNGVVHGKMSLMHHDENGEDGLLAGLSNPFEAARYHSLVIEKSSFPSEELEVTAWTDDGLIMGVRHRKYKHVQGVQFHPESIITPEGKKIVANFLKIIARKWSLEGVKEAALSC